MISYIAIGAALFYAGMYLQRKKEKLKEQQRTFFGPWPIKKIAISELGPRFKLSELGPSLESQIHFLPNIKVKGGISDLETWVLCTLAKNAKRIFEFGTCTGKTAYLLARNAPEDAHIVTLTLPDDTLTAYTAQDSLLAKQEALSESCFQQFYYQGQPEEKKIIQLFADSKTFDEAPFHESFDLIFIDGSHAYSYVKSDTEKALKMIKPGGSIVWHDYRGPKRNKDVYKALNEFALQYQLQHIEKTSCVIFTKS